MDCGVRRDVGFYVLFSGWWRVGFVEVSEALYEELARSEFARIGVSAIREVVCDGERVSAAVVPLAGECRRRLSGVLRDAIMMESEKVLVAAGAMPSRDEFIAGAQWLQQLQGLWRWVADEECFFMGRYE